MRTAIGSPAVQIDISRKTQRVVIGFSLLHSILRMPCGTVSKIYFDSNTFYKSEQCKDGLALRIWACTAYCFFLFCKYVPFSTALNGFLLLCFLAIAGVACGDREARPSFCDAVVGRREKQSTNLSLAQVLYKSLITL